MNDSPTPKPNPKTASEVIDALGGPAVVARRLDCSPQSVCNWRATGKLASWSFLILSADLAAVDLAASPELWGIRSPYAVTALSD